MAPVSSHKGLQVWRKPLGDETGETHGDAVVLFHRNSRAAPSAGRPLVQVTMMMLLLVLVLLFVFVLTLSLSAGAGRMLRQRRGGSVRVFAAGAIRMKEQPTLCVGVIGLCNLGAAGHRPVLGGRPESGAIT